MSDQVTDNIPLCRETMETILQSQLGKNLVVESYSCAYATKPGENFGSTLLAITMTVRINKTSPSKTIHVVAKSAPPSEFLQQAFDMRNTFCKEMNLYKLVRPEIMKLQKEHGVKDEEILDVLPEYYGARTSLAGDQDEFADTNAILLLENLKIAGYQLADRMSGLDLKHCELVISKLAEFHALPVALKQKKPKIYEQIIPKTTKPFKMGGYDGLPHQGFVEEHAERLRVELPESIPYIDRIKANAYKYTPEMIVENLGSELFTSIVHNDFWTNNMMFTYSDAGDNSRPVNVKFVDFQMTLLGSPVNDLIFFIFSSASRQVKKHSYDYLIELYYESYISILKRLECDISAYSLKKLQEQIDEFAPAQFFHVLSMSFVIYAEEKNTKSLSEIDGIGGILNKFSDRAKINVMETIEEFDKRGWL